MGFRVQDLGLRVEGMLVVKRFNGFQGLGLRVEG